MKTKNKKPQPPAIEQLLRASILRHENGEPSEQKDNLVGFILSAFHNPDLWPLTDQQRIAFVKAVYERARKIRDTEKACQGR